MPIRCVNTMSASVPIQRLSTLEAVSVTPFLTTAGKVTPTGPFHAWCSITCATTSATGAGRAGCGVTIRNRGAASWPESMSTGAPLMPLPPMSIPMKIVWSPIRVTVTRPRPMRSGVRSPRTTRRTHAGCSKGHTVDGMTAYVAPLRDIRFALEHLVDLPGLAKLPAFAHADPETVHGLLEEFGRFVGDVLVPLDRVGDTVGSTH